MINMQTVQYSHTGKVIEIECEVRIWVTKDICVSRGAMGDTRYFICRAQTVPREQCGVFHLLGMEEDIGTV
jgi:hypothetical protein